MIIKNEVEYWRHMERVDAAERPTERVCRLLQTMFQHWRRKPCWLTDADTGSIFDGVGPEEHGHLLELSVAERKGLAMQKLARVLTDPIISQRTQTVRISPDDLILGTIPPYSVGMGKELVSYLTQEEALAAAVNFLDERSPFGHVVPDHSVELDRGLLAVIDNLKSRIQTDPDRAAFYRSVQLSLEAVLDLAARWADHAEVAGKRCSGEAVQTLNAAAERIRRVPGLPPESFLDAVQSVFFVHMALHSMGETVPLGRLDQLLWPFLETDLKRGRLTAAEAQEIVDCLVLKLDERAMLNPAHLEDHFSFADGALLGVKGGANFDQGGLLNQWMQQLTLGGVVADNADTPTDASNPLTLMFLESARRLPVNSPTFDLRLHKGSPQEVIQAAAKALLSGGAHPVLLNDDRIIPALQKGTGGSVELKSARNYACDGCYETLFAGETEFSFGVIGAMDAIEKALNQGSGLGAAGPIHLRGSKSSFRTPPADEIADFEAFWVIMERHLELSALRFVSGILAFYGEKEAFAPSPLLSAFINGCIESGRDFSAGGARYHLISPLMTGISTAADSLWILKNYVFGGDIGMAELVSCLRRNWDPSAFAPGVAVSTERMAEIHAKVRQGEKFGRGSRDVDALAWRLIDSFTDAIDAARRHSMFDHDWARLAARYDLSDRPFEILFAPGVGTFEQYVFGGGFVGASPDGRLAGTPIASDFSAAPIPVDEPVFDGKGRHRARVPLFRALSSFSAPSVDKLSDGAPADLNVPEDLPEAMLVDLITRFARGEAGNVLTVTVADPSTLAAAAEDPEGYEFIRVRMGGWTEFFIALFPSHQAQHRRRPLYTAEDPS